MLHKLSATLAVLAAAATAVPAAVAADPRVELKTTQGTIVLELAAERAPQTVANFLQYVKAGHYDGTQFHRVIDGFMIQGGGFDRTFRQKPTRASIRNEADNGLRNERGTVAMARTPDPHSASAQFFINLKDNDFLNHKQPTPQGWGYAVFGKVVAGMDVVDRIAKLPTGTVGPHQNVPAEPVMIEWARIYNAK
ncbi:MAG: peptidyl-prolyl cis-trans isomerase [Burkholderiales bacterium]|nr:peptidyl-prolyl cis-trans isomerase [Burkholderiales bacterium]